MADKPNRTKRSLSQDNAGQTPTKVCKFFFLFYVIIICLCPTLLMGQKIIFSNHMVTIHASKEIISDRIVHKNIEQMIRMIYSFSKDTKNEQVGTALAKGTPGVEQNKPTDDPGTKNEDLAVATAISHIATS